MFFNTNFKTDEVPWIAEDFLGRGNREARRAQMAMDKRVADMANLALQNMKPGQITDDIPIWAIPLKDRKPNA